MTVFILLLSLSAALFFQISDWSGSFFTAHRKTIPGWTVYVTFHRSQRKAINNFRSSIGHIASSEQRIFFLPASAPASLLPTRVFWILSRSNNWLVYSPDDEGRWGGRSGVNLTHGSALIFQDAPKMPRPLWICSKLNVWSLCTAGSLISWLSARFLNVNHASFVQQKRYFWDKSTSSASASSTVWAYIGLIARGRAAGHRRKSWRRASIRRNLPGKPISSALRLATPLLSHSIATVECCAQGNAILSLTDACGRK